uniref:Ig-like domain-containing protein n=1 Tax=Pygocentrus nattereri TaxID=42514 RepID=A0AAR2LVN4_PYGNA
IRFVLFCFFSVKTSNITDLQRQTVRLGDGVTVKCHQKVAKGDLVWYKQSLGMLPQYIVRKVGNKNSRFTVDDKTFDLSINGVKDEDKGIYFCGKGQLATLEFLSGTILLFAGNYIHCNCCYCCFVLFTDTSFISLYSSPFLHFYHTTVEEDTDVLNYATVNFAQKPPSRAPRVKQSQDIYSGVKVR